MVVRRLLVALALLAAATSNANETLSMSFGDYKQARRRATSREAYSRALERLERVRVGMRSDDFFETMGMLIVEDQSGRPVEGFVEGYLHAVSLELDADDEEVPRLLVFGFYENWKRRKQAVHKFTVLLVDRHVEAIEFLDQSDDCRSQPEVAVP